MPCFFKFLKMKNIFILVLMTLFTSLFGQTKVFKGAWFDISYPTSFSANPGIKCQSMEGVESATFVSPDKSVEFYVFSPQWSGEATDIILKNNEKLASEKSDVKENITIKWFTISAKDASYTRSYVQTTTESTNQIFGIKYKNQASFDKYKNEYLAFKKSLIQFAD